MRFGKRALLVFAVSAAGGSAFGLGPSAGMRGRAQAAGPMPEGTVRVEVEPRPPLRRPAGIADAADARAVAVGYDAAAAHYRAQAGFAYKVGLVQRTERAADRYWGLAAAMDAPPVVVRVRSLDAERYRAMAARYELRGAFAWKTGLVGRALAAARRYELDAVIPPYRWPLTVGDRHLPEKPVEASLASPASWYRR